MLGSSITIRQSAIVINEWGLCEWKGGVVGKIAQKSVFLRVVMGINYYKNIE